MAKSTKHKRVLEDSSDDSDQEMPKQFHATCLKFDAMGLGDAGDSDDDLPVAFGASK